MCFRRCEPQFASDECRNRRHAYRSPRATAPPTRFTQAARFSAKPCEASIAQCWSNFNSNSRERHRAHSLACSLRSIFACFASICAIHVLAQGSPRRVMSGLSPSRGAIPRLQPVVQLRLAVDRGCNLMSVPRPAMFVAIITAAQELTRVGSTMSRLALVLLGVEHLVLDAEVLRLEHLAQQSRSSQRSSCPQESGRPTSCERA